MKNKIISILLATITILASISIVYFAIKYDPTKEVSFDAYLGFSWYAIYAVMAIAFVSMFGFAIWSIISNIRDSKETLIGVGILVGIFIISYLFSSPTNSAIETKFAVSSGLSKLIGGGFIATYVFLFGAILAAAWASISTRFK